MARNNRNQIAIYRDVSAVVAVALSPQENGVRVRQVQGPTTTVSLPSDAFPNDGDSYEIIDADGSSSPANQLRIVPPAGTTIRGGAFFAIQSPFESATVTFDASHDEWLVEVGSCCAPGSPPAVRQDTWYVDYANGNNANDGKTQATALKDTGEIRRRWTGGVPGVRPQLPCSMLLIQGVSTIKRAGHITAVPNPFARTATGEQTCTDVGVADWTSDVDHIIADTTSGALAWVTIGGSPATLSASRRAVNTSSLASLPLATGLSADAIAPADAYNILTLNGVYLGSDCETRCTPSYTETTVPVPIITVHLVSPSSALVDPFSDPILPNLADVDMLGTGGLACVVLSRIKAAPRNNTTDWAYVRTDGSFIFTQLGANVLFAECDMGLQSVRAADGVFFANCNMPFLHGDDCATFSSNILCGYSRLNLLMGSRWTADQDLFLLGQRLLQTAGDGNGILIGNFGRFLNGGGAAIVFQISSVDGGRGSVFLMGPNFDVTGVSYGTTSGADIAHLTGIGRIYSPNSAAATFVYDGGAGATFQLGGTGSGYGFNSATGAYVGPTTFTVAHIDAALGAGTGFGGVAIEPKTDNRVLVSGNR
jgi:hypothetical protein